MGKNRSNKNKPQEGGNSKRPNQTIDDGDDQPMNQRKNCNGKGRRGGNGSNNAGDDDTQLKISLASDGLEIIDISPDGNCLFRALSDQLFGDYGNSHVEVRSDICDYMENNKEDFQAFLVYEDQDDEDQQEEDARDFEHYIETMRQDGEWGGNLEIVAAARLYKRKITVYSATLAALTIEHGESKSSGPDLLVSFHDDDNHYNSVRYKKRPPKRIMKDKLNESETSIDQIDNDLESAYNDKSVETTPKIEENIDSNIEDKAAVDGKNKPKNGSRIKKNDPCICGSGLKYKKCCLSKQKRESRLDKIKERGHEGGGAASDNEDEDGTLPYKGDFQLVKI